MFGGAVAQLRYGVMQPTVRLRLRKGRRERDHLIRPGQRLDLLRPRPVRIATQDLDLRRELFERVVQRAPAEHQRHGSPVPHALPGDPHQRRRQGVLRDQQQVARAAAQRNWSAHRA